MLIDSSTIRTNFRVESAMPDSVIDREITYIDDCFTDSFGSAYTDVVLDPSTHAAEAKNFESAMMYLVMARLLRNTYVVTGFGIVIKKDDYSTPMSQDEIDEAARGYVADGSRYLRRITTLSPIQINEAVVNSQNVTEGFFRLRNYHFI